MKERENRDTQPWIEVAPGAPYFQTDRGESWTPIGQNDAVTWPELEASSGAATSRRSTGTSRTSPRAVSPASG
jgi:hypothetical protein